MSAHAFRHWVSNHIPGTSLVCPFLRLALISAVQLPHDASELCLRNGGVFEERNHFSLVWLYKFPMPNVCAMTLSNNQQKHW